MFGKDKKIIFGSTKKVESPEQALAVVEKQLELRERQENVNRKMRDLSARQTVDIERVMTMIGDLGYDQSINQSIIDDLSNVLGNNSDPVKATKYFQGMIARKVLTIADIRKIPGSLFASRGGVPLDITSNLVYVQPAHLFGNCSAIEPARYQQSPLNVAFDENSEISIGVNTFNDYTTNTIGTYTVPFVGHLFVLKRNNILRGDAKFYVESEEGYRAGLQVTDDTAVVLVLNHIKAKKVTSDITPDTATPPNLVFDLNFTSTEQADQFELSFNTPKEVTVTGTNVSITHWQLPFYAPVAEAVLASLFTGRLKDLPQWILNNVSADFMIEK